MSCDLSIGRNEPCKDNVGGIHALYFINYVDGLLETMTTDADDQITGFASPLTLYKYVVKGANSFEETNENSRENGTSFWTQTITALFKKQDKVFRKELKLLSYARPQVIVEDYNGKYFMAGLENGVEVAVHTTTGAGMGDANGYNIVGTGGERFPAYLVDPSIIDDTTNTTVVVGTNS